MVRGPILLASALCFASIAFAQTTCSAGKACPEASPCCSQYGQCGVGAYCLGGCDPRFSFSLDSCTPAPACRSQDFEFTSLNGIENNTEYLGDASKTNWVSSGIIIPYQNQQVLLTMSPNNEANKVGSLMASSAYVWYGKVSATLKTSQGQGVVTAFILLSDVKDEIDFEFIGAYLDDVQSNYYFQGITNYDNEQNISVSDTSANWHTYEVDWTPDTLTWSVDGQVHRTLNKNSTWNATSNQYHFPQTPSRIELSLWPAGASTNAEGTIEWSGGPINWDSSDIQQYGYDFAMFKSVNVTCYSPPSGANVTGNNSYIFTGESGINNTVSLTDDNTVLKSLLGTGTNMSADYPGAASSGAAASSAAQAAAQTNVPGNVGGGGGSGTSGNIGTSNSQSSGVSSAAGSASTGSGGFSQGTKSGGAPVQGEKAVQGSLFAVLVAVVALLVM